MYPSESFLPPVSAVRGDAHPIHPFLRACLIQKGGLLTPNGTFDLSDAGTDWSRTFKRANDEFVVPALWTFLEKCGLGEQLPADVRSYLSYIYSRNASSNQAIRDQCLRIGKILNDVGVKAVLLKGATWLFEPGPARDDRMMRDIDILIGSDDVQKARTALLEAAYRECETIICDTGHIHDVPLICEGEPANVELHVELSTRVWELPATEVLATATSSVAPGLWLPSLYARILHNVIHSQITNGDRAGGVVSPRDALDLARLLALGGNAIDWQALIAIARARGIFDALSAALHKSARFCGAQLPPTLAVNRRGHIHALRCALQRQIPPLDAMLRHYGILRRALAWERDSYALGLGASRNLTAHWKVNVRRSQRLIRAVKRATARA